MPTLTLCVAWPNETVCALLPAIWMVPGVPDSGAPESIAMLPVAPVPLLFPEVIDIAPVGALLEPRLVDRQRSSAGCGDLQASGAR